MATPIELPNRRTQAELFGSAEKSFDSKFKLLTEARYSILISTFTIKADVFYSPDEVARNLANILIEKHRSGLEVKVFTDYWGNVPSTRKEIKRMLSAGVDVRYFAHHTNVFELAKISWNGLLKINLEKLYHGKTLVVDGWHSCTGGYNWMSGETKSNQLWRDTDLCLSGPISRQVSEDFYKFFNRLNRLVPGNTQPETQYLYPPCEPEHEDEYFTQAPWLDDGKTPINDRILDLLHCAKPGDHVYWQSFSFRPQEKYLRAIEEIASRGVKVTILTNSRRSMANQLMFVYLPPARRILLDKMYGEAKRYYQTIIDLSSENPVELFEYDSPYGPMHAKALLLLEAETVDSLQSGQTNTPFKGIAGAGTYNVSPNSWDQHIETMIFTNRPNIVKDLHELYTQDIAWCTLQNK